MQLTLTKNGNSTALTLPKELLARLRLEQGDKVTIVETPDGFTVSKYDEVFARDLELIRGIVHKRRNILAALAGK
jgi:putative addiction module antidote